MVLFLLGQQIISYKSILSKVALATFTGFETKTGLLMTYMLLKLKNKDNRSPIAKIAYGVAQKYAMFISYILRRSR